MPFLFPTTAVLWAGPGGRSLQDVTVSVWAGREVGGAGVYGGRGVYVILPLTPTCHRPRAHRLVTGSGIREQGTAGYW